MSTPPCFTIDVEDWYEGMHALGHDLVPPPSSEPGLGALARLLEGRTARVTLFVVGRHAAAAKHDLRALAAAGHEIASHGPDHGRLPAGGRALDDWLRRGREMIEDVVEAPVVGFRSPRFDVPADLSLAQFRAAIAGAGFSYVSDTSVSEPGSGAPIAELPVARFGRFPFGGGSYQRLLPRLATLALTRRHRGLGVLYYHSYDFGRELPGLGVARSPAVAAQILGRHRIATVFAFLVDRLGSRTCTEACDELR
jgi:hypothetical protein